VSNSAALDGIYVIRTSAAEAQMSAEAAVLNYKRLAEVERAFRTLKGVDLQVRPIRHRLESRVKAHIFLSMLAYYVQWHLAEAWKPLLLAIPCAPRTQSPVWGPSPSSPRPTQSSGKLSILRQQSRRRHRRATRLNRKRLKRHENRQFAYRNFGLALARCRASAAQAAATASRLIFFLALSGVGEGCSSR